MSSSHQVQTKPGLQRESDHYQTTVKCLPSPVPPPIKHNYQVSTGLGRTVQTFNTVEHLGWINPFVTNQFLTQLYPVRLPTKRYLYKYEQAIQLILYNCLCIYLNEERTGVETLMLISRRKAHYESTPEIYLANDIGYPVMMRVLDGLINLNFIQQFKGTNSPGHPHGLKTSIGLTKQSREWLKQYKHLFECGLLKNNHTSASDKKNTRKLVRLKETKDQARLRSSGSKSPQFLDYQDYNNPLIPLKRLAVKSLNRVNTNHVFSVRRCRKSWYDISEGQQVRQVILEDTHSFIPPEQLSYHRIYHGSFKQSGRFHCDAQNLMKEERKTLLIDGKETVELDYKSLHPRMLYHLEGLEAPDDCHHIVRTRTGEVYPRQLSKAVCMRVLNTSSKSACIKSVRKLLKEEGYPDEFQAEQLVSDYEEAHSFIKHQFYDNQWLHLQYLDAVIANKVMTRFVNRKIPILGIHDSFIVQDRYEEDLRLEMTRAYQSTLQKEPLVT